MVGGSKPHSHGVEELTSHRQKKVPCHIRNSKVIKGVLKCILDLKDNQCRKAKKKKKTVSSLIRFWNVSNELKTDGRIRTPESQERIYYTTTA